MRAVRYKCKLICFDIRVGKPVKFIGIAIVSGMCGRSACTLCPEDIQKACGYRDEKSGKFQQPEWNGKPESSALQYKPSYNLAPTDVIPVLVSGSQFHSISERVVQPMIWGMIPPWHKGDPKSHGLTTHNCRLESMISSKLYSAPFKKGHRCVVVCDGFYEWQTTKGKGNKQPYFIYMPQPDGVKIEESTTWTPDWNEEDGWKGPQLLKMAAIYEKWKSPQNDELYSCSVITRESNETLSWLHHRTPVILSTDEQVANWLDSASVPSKKALDELVPVKLLTWHPVSTTVNNSRHKESDCNKPVSLDKPQVKKTASSVLMESWLKKSKSPLKREANEDSSHTKRVKTEPDDN